jgi:hypothetical protein
MQPALASASESVVWSVGLQVLGYPPTWAASNVECRRVIKAIEKEKERE